VKWFDFVAGCTGGVIFVYSIIGWVGLWTNIYTFASIAPDDSIRLQLFSKCSFNPMSVIGYDVG
jgi:hypothetical protein